jgi:hypothetical protein
MSSPATTAAEINERKSESEWEKNVICQKRAEVV